jgi:PTH1 family peptidyl-tRNA hydrolase
MNYLFIGLGNIGSAYTATRHNIGFHIIDQLASEQGVAFSVDRLAFIAAFRYRGKSIYLIKPTTYMNNSGKAVHYWLQKLRIAMEHSVTIVDDLALPFGKLRLRAQGSSGGHNGLKSIEASLTTTMYPRLRVGIGSDFAKGKQSDYVLAPFSLEESQQLPALVAHATHVLLTFCTVGIPQAIETCAKFP